MSVIDFFSGCGGTSAGFKTAGMNIVAGIDSDHDAAATFRRNFRGSSFIEADIKTVTTEQVAELIPSEAITLFSGCAPCQPFSRQNGHRSLNDPRRNLLGEFQRFVTHLRPHLIVVENVPGLQSPVQKGPLEEFLKSISSQGYSFEVGVLRALEYGVPQERRRLVIVASRIGYPVLPPPTHAVGKRRARTVRQAIGNLPPIRAGEVDERDPDHAAMKLSEANQIRIQATPEGGDRRDWDSSLVPDCHVVHGGHTDAYGRMWWDRPATGLTTRCLSYSNGRFGHPEQDRAISLREAACLQTFSRRFRFEGSLTSRGRQVGNAVPPLMARRIGEALIQPL
ncbi:MULTISPECIES: DNA cytosine methyltransferase [Rhodococcus]|uniref:DNA cytosine methyltransferase n=1 Tax=Rhodococcus TaxID=1827 RepID=UPI0022B2D5B6|nr:DNA cytosine methyltransferase [Rhodococcus pyridinivorans]MCZ4625329.1 DNA cytosine methyltransferase [Rhodococcus pyridinivorans]MCZ4646539.1 DNA cytosine methyltransferase [Rhodococcus pyridinivorans]MDJ0482377.1 DNA cytosine methyltransferase [Rhodococcus pyridinivorans]MDV7252908.1 DNA cytosine methyltransferase [Rhodococcus pyridinivorans]